MNEQGKTHPSRVISPLNDTSLLLAIYKKTNNPQKNNIEKDTDIKIHPGINLQKQHQTTKRIWSQPSSQQVIYSQYSQGLLPSI